MKFEHNHLALNRMHHPSDDIKIVFVHNLRVFLLRDRTFINTPCFTPKIWEGVFGYGMNNRRLIVFCFFNDLVGCSFSNLKPKQNRTLDLAFVYALVTTAGVKLFKRSATVWAFNPVSLLLGFVWIVLFVVF